MHGAIIEKRPSIDPMPSASRAPFCGKEPYLSSLSNCGVVAGEVVVVVCKIYFT
jgi:hypothetical protein